MKPHLEELKSEVGNGSAHIVDVRERHEWDAGHIDGATFAPLSDLDRGIAPDTLPKDRVLAIHCRSGQRVKRAAPLLERMGFKVKILSEGFDELVREGFPRAR